MSSYLFMFVRKESQQVSVTIWCKATLIMFLKKFKVENN